MVRTSIFVHYSYYDSNGNSVKAMQSIPDYKKPFKNANDVFGLSQYIKEKENIRSNVIIVFFHVFQEFVED